LNRDIEYESIARKAGLSAMDMEAGRDQSEIPVEMVLKGLWKVDGEVVVEGECPVSIPYSHELLMLDMANDRYVGKDYLGDMDHLEGGLVG
jgi:hypothetical protein